LKCEIINPWIKPGQLKNKKGLKGDFFLFSWFFSLMDFDISFLSFHRGGIVDPGTRLVVINDCVCGFVPDTNADFIIRSCQLTINT
jgi:hypothetical protein